MAKIYVTDRTGGSNEYVWVEYDVDLADPVRKLKADIYETEGVSVGTQCLQYDGIELRDEQLLGSYARKEGYIIDRLPNKILVQNHWGDKLPYEVDLDGRLIDLKQILVSQECDFDDQSSLESNGQVLEWDDGRTLSSLGIRNNDSVVVSFAPLYMEAPPPLATRNTPHKTLRTHKVLYDWNGAMKHPAIAGLSLRRGMRVIEVKDSEDVYRSRNYIRGMRVIEVTDSEDVNRVLWCRGHEEGKDVVGYFPRNYIRASDENAIENSDSTPRLPSFDFPVASPFPAVFSLHLGEKGQSYVQATLSYQKRAPPDEPTPVDVSLVCAATGGRRITSLGLMIRSPGQMVREVKCPELSQPQQSISVEATDNETVENTLGAAFSVPQAGLTANASTSRGHEHTVTESGTRESHLKMSGNPHGEQRDIARWRIDASEGVGGRLKGIPAEMSLSFVLDGKPAIFEYWYLVKSTDARGNSKEHSGGSLKLSDGKSELYEWFWRSPSTAKIVYAPGHSEQDPPGHPEQPLHRRDSDRSQSDVNGVMPRTSIASSPDASEQPLRTSRSPLEVIPRTSIVPSPDTAGDPEKPLHRRDSSPSQTDVNGVIPRASIVSSPAAQDNSWCCGILHHCAAVICGILCYCAAAICGILRQCAAAICGNLLQKLNSVSREH